MRVAAKDVTLSRDEAGRDLIMPFQWQELLAFHMKYAYAVCGCIFQPDVTCAYTTILMYVQELKSSLYFATHINRLQHSQCVHEKRRCN